MESKVSYREQGFLHAKALISAMPPRATRGPGTLGRAGRRRESALQRATRHITAWHSVAQRGAVQCSAAQRSVAHPLPAACRTRAPLPWPSPHPRPSRSSCAEPPAPAQGEGVGVCRTRRPALRAGGGSWTCRAGRSACLRAANSNSAAIRGARSQLYQHACTAAPAPAPRHTLVICRCGWKPSGTRVAA